MVPQLHGLVLQLYPWTIVKRGMDPKRVRRMSQRTLWEGYGNETGGRGVCEYLGAKCHSIPTNENEEKGILGEPFTIYL